MNMGVSSILICLFLVTYDNVHNAIRVGLSWLEPTLVQEKIMKTKLRYFIYTYFEVKKV